MAELRPSRDLPLSLPQAIIILAGLRIGVPDVGDAVLLIYFAVGLFATGIGAIVAGAAG